MAEKKKNLKSQREIELAQMDENIRVARELAERGWAELEAKYAAEGKPMPVQRRRIS